MLRDYSADETLPNIRGICTNSPSGLFALPRHPRSSARQGLALHLVALCATAGELHPLQPLSSGQRSLRSLTTGDGRFSCAFSSRCH